MKTIVKRILKAVGLLLLVAIASVAIYVWVQTSRFDASLDKVYDVPVPTITLSKDPAVLARGKHLTQSVMPCATPDCHGADFAGGNPIVMGPLGTFAGPNVTGAGLGAAYTDGELARMLRHGLRKDGRGLRFMPVQDSNWLPDEDIVAMVSYLRAQPPVDKPNGPMQIGTLAKIIDRQDKLPLDVARRIDHTHVEIAPPPSPTADYGRFVGRLCTGCHGEHLSGGPLPGAPPEIPIPLNITPDASGIKDWTYDDFARLLDTGIRKNGKKLDRFMPLVAFVNYDETERHALWAYLRTLPPTPFGNR